VKITSLLLPAAVVALLATVIFAATTGAQSPQSSPSVPAAPATNMPPSPRGVGQTNGPGGRPMRNYPLPTNLQVLPKDLTGRQVRDMMETWAGSLGVKCEFCHTADPKNVGPNGRPRTNFADDSKPDKQIARIMYTMTQQMNTDYISKAMDLDKDGMGKPVTCGTCHRGHEMPEDFVIPREERRGGPDGGPGGPPPAAGATPPSN
jgi:Photosynthetic reaction centre cytochrome C subunit